MMAEPARARSDVLLPPLRPAPLSGDGFAAQVASGMAGSSPRLVHLSPQVARSVGLVADAGEADLAALLSGKAPPADAAMTASVYAGHQFGVWVPQLGDGRALSYGVVDTEEGPLELQLKGAGRTPFSRFGDGRAVLRSSIREYLCSEAMAALGIPTTRALSVVTTGEQVMREMPEPGAVVMRVAPSFLRFGHAEYFSHTGQIDKLRKLADHLLAAHFPEVEAGDHAGLFRQIVIRTARLAADWQAVGFAHGVLNTDNMSLLGLTIDYGPFGFLEAHDPGFICNHSDSHGRYAFGMQPEIAHWNCRALAAAFAALVSGEALSEGLSAFAPAWREAMTARHAAKLGLDGREPGDPALIGELLDLMAKSGADHTMTFRLLSHLAGDGDAAFLAGFGGLHAEAAQWLARWTGRRIADDVTRERTMRAANPRFVLRNWVAETAIRAVEDRDDLRTLDAVFRVVTDPYADVPAGTGPDAQAYAGPAPEAMRHLEVSCSS